MQFRKRQFQKHLQQHYQYYYETHNCTVYIDNNNIVVYIDSGVGVGNISGLLIKCLVS